MSAEVIHGDCVDILPNYEGEIDLIVTSPPYGDLRNYGGGVDAYDFDKVAPLIADALTDGGVLCWNIQDQQIDGSLTLTSFRNALAFRSFGLKCLETLVLHMGHPKPRQRRYLRMHEHLFVFGKGEPKTFNPIADRVNTTAGDKRKYKFTPGRSKDGKTGVREGNFVVPDVGKRVDVWRVKSGFGHTSPDIQHLADKHPAMMPIGLAKDLIRTYSNEGDMVLDPFAGGGTTLVAARQLYRNVIGIEIHEPYVHQTRARLSQSILPLVTSPIPTPSEDEDEFEPDFPSDPAILARVLFGAR